MPTLTDLKLLCMTDVCRAVGWSRKRIEDALADDIADGTPGLRFPLPLRDPAGRPPGPNVQREWLFADLHAWIERRKQ